MNSRLSNIKRTSIFMRSPVLERYSISLNSVTYSGCKILDNGLVDCSNTEFSTFPDYGDSRTILIVLNSENHDWDEILELIALCKERHRYIRIITEVVVPMEILCAFTYHPCNVIQYNIDIKRGEYSKLLRSSIYNAKICGAYITVFIYPIIPTIITVSNVIEMTVMFKNLSDHICVKLLEVDQPLDPVDGLYNINGNAVPEKYLERCKDGVLRCSKYYRAAFSNALTKYTIPNKVNLSICDQGKCY